MPTSLNVFNHVLIIVSMTCSSLSMSFNSNVNEVENKNVTIARMGTIALLFIVGIAFSWYVPVGAIAVILLAVLNYFFCLKDTNMAKGYVIFFLLIILLEILLVAANIWC